MAKSLNDFALTREFTLMHIIHLFVVAKRLRKNIVLILWMWLGSGWKKENKIDSLSS